MEAKNTPKLLVYTFILGIFAALSAGCGAASLHGTATAVDPGAVQNDGQWKMVKDFPVVLQSSGDDCGAAALSAVVRYWGYAASPGGIETALGKTDHRLQAADMEAYAQTVGLQSYVFYGTMKDVVHELDRGRPVIVGLGKSIDEKKALAHYEVVIGYDLAKRQVLLLDPGRGLQVDSFEGFAKEWAISKAVTIVAFPTNAVVASGESSAANGVLLPSSRDATLASASEEQAYSAREQAAPEAKKYRAGDVIVIGGTTLAIILLVVLILILI